MDKISIFWFRRDLRLKDNHGLYQALESGKKVLPFFIFDEEFTYLYRLKDEPSLTKMQLIERNGHEKQTGIQIIKRLLDDGLIQETVDENDKRAKRLTLTKKGEKAFHQSVEKVNTTSKILSANLKSDEKTKLLELLKKVNDFHYTLYTEYKNSEIKELLHLIE